MEVVAIKTSPCEVLERKLVHHCTPTLAALKPANLFTCHHTYCSCLEHPHSSAAAAPLEGEQFCAALRACRAKLAAYGVHIRVLSLHTTGRLVFVYRPCLLADTLQEIQVARYLENEGYDPFSVPRALDELQRRIRRTQRPHSQTPHTFPHEIGFFLGYPFDDVIGFISNRGRGAVCNGCWKVYSQTKETQQNFRCYKAATLEYERLFQEGVSLEYLASIDEKFPAKEAFSAVG